MLQLNTFIQEYDKIISAQCLLPSIKQLLNTLHSNIPQTLDQTDQGCFDDTLSITNWDKITEEIKTSKKSLIQLKISLDILAKELEKTELPLFVSSEPAIHFTTDLPFLNWEMIYKDYQQEATQFLKDLNQTLAPKIQQVLTDFIKNEKIFRESQDVKSDKALNTRILQILFNLHKHIEQLTSNHYYLAWQVYCYELVIIKMILENKQNIIETKIQQQEIMTFILKTIFYDYTQPVFDITR
ncbi:MAG: hypothetical protein HAW62_01570 [Endozoicomonadaceae bacterium]|nr:hypothetical protein [Endozoicomonadaceae bacterium]